MILISHRGNTNGKQSELENMPEYIDNAIKLGYDVEVDIRFKSSKFYLGHDNSKCGISLDWLKHRSSKLWLHCKNMQAIEQLSIMSIYNYFWHDSDAVTITSRGYIWMSSKIKPLKNSIAVIPELTDYNLKECAGICSDNIEVYNERY